jgi:hypothetical protein
VEARVSGLARWRRAFSEALTSRTTLTLAALIAGFAIIANVLLWKNGWNIRVRAQLYSKPFQFGTVFFVIGLIAWRSFYIMIVRRPVHLTREIIRDLRDDYLTPEKIAAGLPVIFLCAFMLSYFTAIKAMIPDFNPFRYDALFSRIDRALHFGRQPWEWIFPILRPALLTSLMSFVYKTWFVAKFTVLFWQAFSLKKPIVRERFLLTYALTWMINGALLATLLSSAGPCFYSYVVGPENDPYAPLMSFLRASNEIHTVWELSAQEYLWSMHVNSQVQLFAGVSAMPSLHVSLAVLFALLAWQYGRKTRIFFAVYLVLIFLGSIHFGWHYAIDGYVAALTTTAIWWGVGAVQRKLAASGPPTTGPASAPTPLAG